MTNSSFLTRCLRLAVLAGPLAAVSLILTIAAEVTGGVATSGPGPALGIVAAAAGILSTIGIAIGLMAFHASVGDQMQGRGDAAVLVAVAGAVLASGAVWSLLFVLPGLAQAAPDLVTTPLPSVVTGFIGSNLILGLGGLVWAVTARRQGVLSRGITIAAVAGGILCMTPLPARFFLLAIAVSLAARSAAAPLGRALTHPASPATARF